jgi:hypothetical protein
MQDSSLDIISQAAALLIAKGYTREWAEEVLRLKTTRRSRRLQKNGSIKFFAVRPAMATPGGRQQILDEHRRDGIPPYEPPAHE